MKLSARELIRQEQAIKERRRYRKPVISLDDNLHAAEPTELADDQCIGRNAFLSDRLGSIQFQTRRPAF